MLIIINPFNNIQLKNDDNHLSFKGKTLSFLNYYLQKLNYFLKD